MHIHLNSFPDKEKETQKHKHSHHAPIQKSKGKPVTDVLNHINAYLKDWFNAAYKRVVEFEKKGKCVRWNGEGKSYSFTIVNMESHIHSLRFAFRCTNPIKRCWGRSGVSTAWLHILSELCNKLDPRIWWICVRGKRGQCAWMHNRH